MHLCQKYLDIVTIQEKYDLPRHWESPKTGHEMKVKMIDHGICAKQLWVQFRLPPTDMATDQ